MITDYNKQSLLKSFKDLRIKKTDSLFLTTSLGNLGIPETTNKKYLFTISSWILGSLRNIIGKKGNIFVPTYSYTFSKKNKVFNPKKTKSKIGYFGNFFLKQKKTIRSNDPMMSIAGQGPNVKKIFNKLPNNSFGKNCVFERFLKIKNLKCLTIGLGYNYIPFLHYLDWLNKVPFRFDKELNGYIKNKHKKKLNWIFFARILREETTSNGYKIGYKALKNNLYKKSKLGKSNLYIADYKKLFRFSKKITKKNIWLTVNGPKFKTQPKN